MPIDYAQFSGKCTRAPPNAATVQAGEAIKLLLSGQASTQKDAAALVHVSESTLSKLKTKTKAPTTKWHRRPTVQVEIGPRASYSKELRFGEQMEQAGEAHARAVRNYRRKMAALKELQQRSVAQVVEVDGTGEHTEGPSAPAVQRGQLKLVNSLVLLACLPDSLEAHSSMFAEMSPATVCVYADT